MRRFLCAGFLLVVAALAVVQSGDATAGLVCSLTGTKISACCCQSKGGKLYCPLANKAIESCCCQPSSK